jgi:thiamine transport system ATP-binding protein
MIGIAPARRPVAFLFQDHNLFAHLSVEANVGLGIAPDLKLSAAQQGLVREALARVGLEDKAARKPGALSGGERQRAAFARILVQSRPILLLDEPFASLGPSLRKEMMQLLSALAKEKQLTILAVTHHPDEWHAIADQFVFIENGNVSATGPIEALNASFEKATLRAYFDNKSIFKRDGTSSD